MKITEAEASQRLWRDVSTFERAVYTACTLKPTQPQFDAMVSLAFNIGSSAFARSTVLRAHNAGDFAAASRAFSLWNKAGGKELRGLVRRRADESALYLTPVPSLASLPEPALPPPMPQIIDPERPVRESEINRAAIGAGALGTVSLVGEAGRAAGEVRSGLGDWLVPALLVAVVALCAYIVVQRRRQRKGGWA
jgi:lysozyme